MEAHAQAAGVQGRSGIPERCLRGGLQSGHVPAISGPCVSDEDVKWSALL